MYRSFALVSVLVAILGLSACAIPTPSRTFEGVPPGKQYEGGYINIAAPKSEGWHLVESSTSGMAFARSGDASNESFAAQVSMFDLPQTNSPEEFEALITRGVEEDSARTRFTTKQFSHQYSHGRIYPCLQIHSVLEDKYAQTSSSKTESLQLESESLYCRHPVRRNTGFAATYSYRGRGLYPDFHNEAQKFIDGVQVPDH